MARAQRIEKIKFLSINREIKEAVKLGKYSAARIAKKHHVSEGTIRAIRRAKTWPGFITAKQLKITHDMARRAAAFKKSQEQPAEKISDLPETTTTQSLPNRSVTKRPLNEVAKGPSVEDQLATALAALEERPTRDEFVEELKIVHDRLDVQYNLIRRLISNPIVRLFKRFESDLVAIDRSRQNSDDTQKQERPAKGLSSRLG